MKSVKVPDFNWRDLELQGYVDGTVHEILVGLQKTHPNIYVFYSLDEYVSYKGSISELIELGRADIDHDVHEEINLYKIAKDKSYMWICSGYFETK